MNLWRPKFRTSASLLTLAWGVVFVVTVFLSAMRAEPAYAMAGGAVQNPASTVLEISTGAAGDAMPATLPNPPKGANKVATLIHDEILTPYVKMALLSLLVNVFQYVLNTLAYDAAVAIASGGKAQGTLFTAESPGQAWATFGLDAAGEAIGSLSQMANESEWAKNIGLNFDACAPDVDITFALQIGLKGVYERPVPACKWSEISQNWSGFFSEMQTKYDNASEMTLRSVAQSVLKPGESTLSAVTGISIATHSKALEEKQTEFAAMLFKDGFKDKVNPITDRVQTPSEILKSQTEERLVQAQFKDGEKNLDLIAMNSDLAVGMVTSATSTFLNTLLSQLIKNIYEGMFDPAPYVNPFDELSADIPGREEAEARFSEMIRTTPIVIDDYNVLSEFVVCTASGSVLRQSNNCVMDANFAAAVVRSDAQPGGMTIAEAIDEGLLKGDWPLISPDDLTRNQDPYCYSYGYCYGNLVKMRKARILPIGWELAAASSKNSEGSPITLQQVIDGFDDCNSDGQLDETHEWCHLIDPNWVLKYPQSQCDAQVSGEILISQFSAGRGTSCVDAPSCIAEDDDGQCVGGYGYCTREKNVWRFRGDECPEEYATCLSFENATTGATGDFLLNTVDFNGCTAANAGCMWYQTNKRFDDAGTSGDAADDAYAWLPTGEVYVASEHDAALAYDGSSRTLYDYYTGAATYDYSTYAYEDRVYYTNDAAACAAADAGCTRLYAAGDGLSLNLVQNGSFEIDNENDNVADGWIVSGATYDEAGSNAAYGISGYHLDADTLIERGITLQQGVFYALSFYAKDGSAAGTGTAAVTLDFVASDGSAVDFSGYSMDCTLIDADSIFLSAPAADVTSSYASFECAFTTPLLSDPTLDLVATVTVGGATDVYVDAVQLEAGAVATDFHDGYNSTAPTETDLTLPPAYLGCTGNATDPAECDSYARLCSATDVGCTEYTPVNGGPSVPAVLSALDQCPEECSGYTTYKQEATLYDAEDFPLYFIADTAAACTEDYVGCDEFTNLETEGVETYTYLRACVTPDMNPGSPYFTWEGSDMAGYQLVSWQLLESSLSDAAGLTFSEDPALTESKIGKAPCVRWVVSSEDTLTCVDTGSSALGIAYVDEIKAQDDCNEHDDIFSNPDCREFFDTEGGVHYRLWSETVTVNADCTAYRKTESNNTDCDASGGFYTTAGECRYFGYEPESDSCPEQFAGCRKYTGGAGRNAATVYEDDVEDGDVAEYAAAAAAASVSNESVATDGHSMRVGITAAGGYVSTLSGYNGETYDADDAATCNGAVVTGGCDVGDCTVEDGDDACGTLNDLLVADKTYILRFWAKGSGGITVNFVDQIGAGDAHDFVDLDDTNAAGSLELSNTWELYELGPLDTSAFPDFDDRAVLQFGAASGTIFYLDNIELIEAEENIALIKDSWVTPSTCDTTPAGGSSPQYYLGCDEYSDSEDETFYIYRFSRLCNSDAIGCQAYYDTQNSESPYPEAYTLSCYLNASREASAVVSTSTACVVDGETVCTIPPGSNTCQFDLAGALPVPLPGEVALGPAARLVGNDSIVYLIDDGSAECSASAVGCTEVGRPNFSPDRTVVEDFESVYFLDLPDTYGTILCEAEALFCEEWSTTQDGNYMFKDPGDQTCEYKTNVNADSSVYSGWFRTGTNEFCYGTGTCSAGATACTTDADCALVGEGNCSVTDGTYIEAGSISGIWRNGDAGYDGWAAACGSQYDLCTSFTDPLDTGEGENPDGQQYFYKDNAAIDESALTSAERCNGQVSLSKGCVLMADGNEVTFAYSSSPSYIASERADALFGDAPRSLEDPISCPDGGEITLSDNVTTVDLCHQRCAYEVASGTDILNAAVEGPVTSGGTDTYYGSSCLDHSDCPVIEDSLRNDVTGTCLDIAAGSVYEFDNDTNRVLKVYRDRECAEWLACSSAGPATWDEISASYKDICDSVDLCTEYAGSGDSNFCSQWKSREPIVLSAEQYSSRDTSWYGLEYSGYSIPDMMPVEVLDQVDISDPPKACISMIDGSIGAFCESSGECSAASVCQTCDTCPRQETDYRLAFMAGACDGDNGSDCTIGFCETSGLGCSGADDSLCDSTEACITGYCELPSPTDASCLQDADCASQTPYLTCRSGICTDTDADNDGSADGCSEDTVSVDCGLTWSCVPAALAKAGSCYNNMCLLGANGGAFETTAEEMSCRGYPDSLSPYTTQVVKTWIEPESVTIEGSARPADSIGSFDVIPYDYVYGFEQVSTCSATGTTDAELTDGCVCSYDKAEYGNGALTRYYPPSTLYADIPGGLCSGGTASGQVCDPTVAGACGEGGTCTAVTGKDTYLGMFGYCLERDSSIQIFGSNSDKDRACLTWLPVDQLSGATNPYAKDYGAGYQGDAYYCADIEAAYDIWTTTGPSDGVSCAESYTGECNDKHSWSTTENDAFIVKMLETGDCAGSIECPNGFFGVMTGCGDLSYLNADDDIVCDSSGSGDKDCPFFCVPKKSYKTADDADGIGLTGDPCLTPDKLASDGDLPIFPDDFGGVVSGPYTITEADSEIRHGTNVNPPAGMEFQLYVMDNKNNAGTYDFGNVVDFYSDCAVKGIVDENLDDEYFYPYGYGSAPGPVGGGQGRDDISWNIQAYPACVSVVQTSSSQEIAGSGGDDHFNFAWTDRVWSSRTPSYAITGIKDETFGYTALTEKIIFGSSRSPYDMTDPGLIGEDPWPPMVVHCTDGEPQPSVALPEIGDACSGDTPDLENSGVNGEDARAYLDIYSVKSEVDNAYAAIACSGPSDTATCNAGFTCEPGDTDWDDDGVMEDECVDGPYAGFECESDANCQPVVCAFTGTDSDGNPLYACAFGGTTLYSIVADEAADDATKRLGQIFGRPFNLFTFVDGYDGVASMLANDWNPDDGPSGEYDEVDGVEVKNGDPWYWDSTETGITQGLSVDTDVPTPPVVASIGECFGTLCREGAQGTFSVNDLPEGNVTGEGSANVVVSFFTWADSDQMPIRGINVDWGDGERTAPPNTPMWPTTSQSGSDSGDNYYPNHRGLKDTETTTTWCDADDEWGFQSSACDSSYLYFKHAYVCNSGDVDSGNLPECDFGTDGVSLLNSPCTGGEVADGGACVFQPRVHVRDNWGWCTGTCTGEPGGEGCYDNSYDTGDLINGYNECDVNCPSESSTACPDIKQAVDYPDDANPWVYYDGYVIVKP